MISFNDDPIPPSAHALIAAKARRIARYRDDPSIDYHDIVQDLILRVLQKLNDFKPDRAMLEAFLNAIIPNVAVDWWRSHHAKKRRPRYGAPLTTSEIPEPPDPRSAKRAEAVDRALDIFAALADLPEPLRELALQLLTHSPAETARERNCPHSTQQRALARIRDHFESRGLDVYC